MAGFGSSGWGVTTLPEFHPAKPRRTKKPEHHWYSGIATFTGHLLGDVRDTVVGLPSGIVNIFRNPVGSLKTIAHSTWQDWSPLFHGDTDKFWHNFTEHPLAPILDVASVVTLGLGSAARGVNAVGKAAELGSAARGASAVTKASQIGKLERFAGGFTTEAEKVLRTRTIAPSDKYIAKQVTYSKNPVVRARQQTFEKIAAKTAPKVFGDTARQARHNRMTWIVRQAASDYEKSRAMKEMIKAAKRVSTMTTLKLQKAIEPQLRKALDENAILHEASKVDQGGLPEGFQMLREARAAGKHPTRPYLRPGRVKGLKESEITDWLDLFPVAHMTKKLDDAAIVVKDGKEYVKLIRDGEFRGYVEEAANSLKTLRLLYNAPTTAWKYLVLGYAPRYLVNNTLGNFAMAMMAQSPAATATGLYHAYKEFRGAARAKSELFKATRGMAIPERGVFERQLQGEMMGFGSEFRYRKGRAHSSRLASAREGLNEGRLPVPTLFSPTHVVSDIIPRRVYMHGRIKSAIGYQDAYEEFRAQGLSVHDAHMKAAERVLQDPHVVEGLRQDIRDVLGEYHHYSKLESKVKKLVPFYAWDRAIFRHSVKSVGDRPWEAAYAVQLGEMGREDTLKKLGHIPDFLEDVVPLGSGKGMPSWLRFVLGVHPVKGREAVLSTQGVNPWATVGELTDAAQAVLGTQPGDRKIDAGEALGSELNPIVSSIIEHATGRSLLTGAEKPDTGGGFLGAAYLGTAQQTPEWKILQTLLHGAPKRNRNAATGKLGPPKLYAGDLEQQIRSMLGIPTKQVSIVEARNLYNLDRGKRKRQPVKPGMPVGSHFSTSSPWGEKTFPGLPGY